MKKGKTTILITIGLMFLVLTAVIFIQFKTINQTDITVLENMREEELRKEISTLKQKTDEINKQIEETNLKITEYEKAIFTDKQASELLVKELEKQNNLLGRNNVKGKGVIVTLNDTRAQRITAEDLRMLLNELRLAGAEAISINNQRIVYNSYIVDINLTYIMVNEERIGSPYEVRAIGDPVYLESGLSKKQYGYLAIKLEEGKDITLTRQENMIINKYNGNLNMEYLKAKEAQV